MKQSQVNKFFSSMTSHQMLSTIASPTTTAPSKHRKNASSTISNGNKYLVYAKRTSRVFKDSSQKLPTLTTVLKTESQELPKTAIQFTRKASNNSGDFRINHQHHRNKTETLPVQINTNVSKLDSPIENFEVEQKVDVKPLSYRTEQVETVQNTPLPSARNELKFSQILHKVQMAAVVGEVYEFKKTEKQKPKLQKQQVITQITEKESLNEKSCHLMRKLTQLLNTHRDKQKLFELEQKKKRETIHLVDREFTQTLGSMPEERTPKISEKFNQKLSTITKKQSKINQNFSAQESESMLPLKSIIEALKDKKEEKKERKKSIIRQVDLKQQPVQQQPVQKQPTLKKLKITIVYEQNEQQTEFLLPDYMNDVPTNQEQMEVKESKKSNIYSLVSKSMLQNKFALRLVKKFGDKVIKTQEDNDAIENFNSFKASQFTRYYLQNHFQKCLEIKYDNSKEKDQFQSQNIQKQPVFDSTIYQETFIELMSKSTQQEQQNLINKGQHKKSFEISNHFYQITSSFDAYQQNENSLLSPSGSQLDVSDIELQTYYKINYIYYQLNLVPVCDLRQNKLRVIVNTVDDETKNKFLHEELLQFPQIINLVIITENQAEDHQLNILNELERQMHKKNKVSLSIEITNKFTKIQTGLFEDYFYHQITEMEKIYIQYCRTIKDLDQIKLNKERARTENVINLNIPQKSRSRVASPSGSSESKTLQKEHKELNPMIAKNMMLKKHQRSKNLLGTQKIESSSQNVIGSVSNLQTLLHAQTNSQPQQRSQRFQTQGKEPEPPQLKQKISQRNIAIKQGLVTQQSMDPFSLLFRSMLLQESQQNDKSTIERVFSLIEDHRFQDLKDLLNHDQNIHINSQDQLGNTFLIFAARTGAHDIINYLLRQGADPQIKNNEGFTALQIAIQHLQYEAADEISKFGRSNSYISH